MSAPRDRWLDIALWVVGVAIAAIVIYVGVGYFTQTRTQSTSGAEARAIINLEKVVRNNPGNEAARITLAQALAAEGDIDQAAEQFAAAIKINKDSVQALIGLGAIAMQRKEYQIAQGYFQRVIDLLDTSELAGKDPRLEQAYYSLGVTYLELKQNEEAAESLREALRIRKDNSNSHYALSVAYGRLKLYDKQRQELQITLSFDPGKPEANYDMGLVLLKEKDIAGAAELFRISSDNAPNTDLPRIELQKFGSASDHLQTAMQLEASDPAKALTEARIAAALDPLNTEAVRLTARLWEVRKDKERALNAWQRLLELLPTDPAALDAIKRLNPNG